MGFRKGPAVVTAYLSMVWKRIINLLDIYRHKYIYMHIFLLRPIHYIYVYIIMYGYNIICIVRCDWILEYVKYISSRCFWVMARSSSERYKVHKILFLGQTLENRLVGKKKRPPLLGQSTPYFYTKTSSPFGVKHPPLFGKRWRWFIKTEQWFAKKKAWFWKHGLAKAIYENCLKRQLLKILRLGLSFITLFRTFA